MEKLSAQKKGKDNNNVIKASFPKLKKKQPIFSDFLRSFGKAQKIA